VRYTAEGAKALEDLCGIFGFVEVDGQEAVMSWHVEGRRFASAQEVGDILHLHEGHVGALELDR
jgi:hypothetical protein